MVFDINPAPISDKDCYTLLKDPCMVIEDVIQYPDLATIPVATLFPMEGFTDEIPMALWCMQRVATG
jgi:hypothetical protein